MIGPVIRLHPDDNVVVARLDVAIGTPVPGENFTSRSQVPAGYKIAARRIAKGEAILKYNVTVGFANVDIEPGTMVHSHNTEFREFDRDYAYASEFKPVQLLPESERATFQGYVRADGRVGTRNFIGLLSTVNCSATVVAQDRRVVHAGAAGGISECRRRRRLQPLHRLRHGDDRRADAAAAPDHGRLRAPSQPGGGAGDRPGLRAQPAQGPDGAGAIGGQPEPAHLHHAGDRRHPQNHRGRHRGGARAAARSQQGEAADRLGQPPQRRPAMRRLRRLLVDHRQPGARRGHRHPGAPWRHRHPVRDAGDLRRRTHADAPRRQPRRSARS